MEENKGVDIVIEGRWGDEWSRNGMEGVMEEGNMSGVFGERSRCWD